MNTLQVPEDAADFASVGDSDTLFPVLQLRKEHAMDQHVDLARRVLWRAFQHGSLSEEELIRTLDRLST